MPGNKTAPILRTDALTRTFGALVAVDRLDLAVDRGEIFGLLGTNGAGKTTTIKMLTTLLPPTSGRATVAGFDVGRQPAKVRRHIGYVPQMISADGALTGYENLLIFARLYDIPRREREARIRDALRFMEIDDSAGRLVREYSGGMIRRLEIAQSILHRPQILFMDEPTIGLDPNARRLVWERVLSLRDNLGTTIFMTTHLMDEADEFCRRVSIMNLGKVVASGSPEALKRAVGAGATFDDVFVHYTGSALERGGTYRETSRLRRTARRLG